MKTITKEIAKFILHSLPFLLSGIFVGAAIYSLVDPLLSSILVNILRWRPSPTGATRDIVYRLIGVTTPDANDRLFTFLLLSAAGLLCLLQVRIPFVRRAWPEILLVALLALLAPAVWLLPLADRPGQPLPTISFFSRPSPTPLPTPVTRLTLALIPIPAEKIPPTQLKQLQIGDHVEVIFAPANGATGTVVETAPITGTLELIYDSDNKLIYPPYTDVSTIEISIARGPGEVNVQYFLRELSTAERVYILPSR